MARSAPLASASRSTCCERAGPEVMTTTSPAVLFLLAQRFFERVGVGLVHFVGNVFADPGGGFVELERCILLRHLLHANQDFQTGLLDSCGFGSDRKTMSV